jgi:glycosyltransferase involved in cell wall biosynthesis/peptidoglycan/xylan/chitin deacetylase (PgdA/CDA1 family)
MIGSAPGLHDFEPSRDFPDSYSRIPLRIAFLMDHPSPHMTSLLEAVAARKDCTLEVLYCGKRSAERNWGSPTGLVPHAFMRGVTGPLGFRFNPGIFRAMGRLRVDIWVVNTVYSSLSTWMAAWWLQNRRKTWVFMNEPVRPRSRLCSFLKEIPLRYVIHRAKGVIGTGKAAIEMYRRKMRPNCPTASVPYFIDLSDFSTLPCPVSPVNGQDLQFVTSGQMIQRKGMDCLLRTCEKLPETGWHLTLIGDGPLRAKLEREFDPLVRCGKVRFMGAIPYQNRARAFVGRHVFVFPSRWDGWGMVVPEALAAGLPVIATDQVTSAHEFIRNGENGFIVPAGNPESLAEKMNWFLNHKSEFSQMSYAARKSIENYRSDFGAASLVEYLHGIRNGKSQGASRRFEPDKDGWRQLTASQEPLENVRQTVRGFAKDAVIRSNLVFRRPRKAGGHLIVGYHLVLKEDKSNFEDHLKFFRDHFRICSVPDLLRAAVSGDETAFRLAITFDDGFRALMPHCLEMLDKYEIKAGFFIPSAYVSSGLIGKDNAAEFSIRSFHYKYPLDPMRPEDLKKLVEMGHEVGSHGMFHTSLQSMTPESAREELSTSRAAIAEWTGIVPNGFCYPYGKPESSLGNPADWLRETGFSYGLTLIRGSIDQSTNRFSLPRHHLEGNWPIRHLMHFLLH